MKNNFLLGAGLALITAGWVRVYGEYKYYCGKVDANKFNKIIIDSERTIIEMLLNKLKEKEEEEENEEA